MLVVAVWTSAPDLAVIVNADVPFVFAATEILDEREPLRATEAGDTLHVDFGGPPVQPSVTVPEKPFTALRTAE
jgi:protease II